MSDVIDIVRQVTACVHHKGDDEYALQIELGNDLAILFTVRKDEPLHVTLWRGNGEWDLAFCDSIKFREFVAEAFEPR